MEKNDYYVYVYIDPRNYEEFYYGKGQGNRKYNHLYCNDDSEKTQRINEIRKSNLEPIIRVIASNLNENEALLIEATLIWKLGKYTSNKISGHNSDKFRPHNTLHKELRNFDYKNGLYFYNIGEGDRRNWDDYVKYSIISAGGENPRWKDAIINFNIGDIFVAYLKTYGYVGIGRITEEAKPVKDISIDGKSLLEMELIGKMNEKSNDFELSEYVCKVEWIKKIDRKNAIWEKNSGLYTPQLVRASLENQVKTIKFIEQKFVIKFSDYFI